MNRRRTVSVAMTLTLSPLIVIGMLTLSSRFDDILTIVVLGLGSGLACLSIILGVWGGYRSHPLTLVCAFLLGTGVGLLGGASIVQGYFLNGDRFAPWLRWGALGCISLMVALLPVVRSREVPHEARSESRKEC